MDIEGRERLRENPPQEGVNKGGNSGCGDKESSVV